MRSKPATLALVLLAVVAVAGITWAVLPILRPPDPPPPPPVGRAQTGMSVPPTGASAPPTGISAPPASRVRVAAIQCPSVLGDVEGNSARLERLVREAAAGGARIVVMPEAAVTGYLSQDLRTNWRLPGWPLNEDFHRGRSPAGIAQTVPGPTTECFGALAWELGIYLVVTCVEVEGTGEEARFFNTACLIDPEGRVALHYRKLNPWPYPEDSWATPGDRGLAVAETPWGRMGLLICYDVHNIPERLAGAGAGTLLYPIAWVDVEGSDWFEKDLPEIARKHGVNIVGANWSVEKKQDWPGYGQSRIIDASGKILAAAETDLGEEIIYAEIETGGGERE